MKVQVERDDSGARDGGQLKRLRFDGRQVDVVENLDRWFGQDYAYFKVRGDDGNLYILRLDETRDAWELIMFQRPATESYGTASYGVDPARPRSSEEN